MMSALAPSLKEVELLLHGGTSDVGPSLLMDMVKMFSRLAVHQCARSEQRPSDAMTALTQFFKLTSTAVMPAFETTVTAAVTGKASSATTAAKKAKTKSTARRAVKSSDPSADDMDMKAPHGTAQPAASIHMLSQELWLHAVALACDCITLQVCPVQASATSDAANAHIITTGDMLTMLLEWLQTAMSSGTSTQCC